MARCFKAPSPDNSHYLIFFEDRSVMDHSQAMRAAVALTTARRSGERIDALPDGAVPQSHEDAYQIQDCVVACYGERVGAWKVGATHPVAQENSASLGRLLRVFLNRGSFTVTIGYPIALWCEALRPNMPLHVKGLASKRPPSRRSGRCDRVGPPGNRDCRHTVQHPPARCLNDLRWCERRLLGIRRRQVRLAFSRYQGTG